MKKSLTSQKSFEKKTSKSKNHQDKLIKLSDNEKSEEETKNRISFSIDELIPNQNDDKNSLIQKNRKLVNLLIQATNKIANLNNYNKKLENDAAEEKSEMVQRLEKININYKIYAESHQNFQELKNEYENLKKDYEHNYNILIYYEDLINYTIEDFVVNFQNLTNFLLESQSVNEMRNFLINLRESYKKELKAILMRIDGYNFSKNYKNLRNICQNIPKNDDIIFSKKNQFLIMNIDSNIEPEKTQDFRQNKIKTQGNSDIKDDVINGICLDDYSAVNNNQISFRKGDIIEIIQVRDDRLWLGKLKGNEKIGLFPANLIKVK